MNQIVSMEEDEDLDYVDIEDCRSGRLSFDGSEKVSSSDDDLTNPLMKNGKRRERNSQSLDLSGIKFDNLKSKKLPSKKPPRPPKGPSLSANDQNLMKEITELALRKRARIERMKTLRRMKAAKSSPCSTILAMVVTVIFFFFLIFQGFFTSSSSLISEKSPGPNNHMVSVQFYNEFAPRERIDSSTITSFRYMRKRVSGSDNEENTREVIK